ncbi:hypothetical protein QZH41_005688 [Actinostola sp. cb2023]|nr:hypothetical protein QZH41_005688 [Actinostola sp. cb2023]
MVSVSSASVSVVCSPSTAAHPVTVQQDKVTGNVTIENEYFVATFDGWGRVTSLTHSSSERQAVSSGCLANQFVLFDDIPLFWDAWDVMPYYLEKRKPLVESTSPNGILKVVERGPLRVTLEVCGQRWADLSEHGWGVSLMTDSKYGYSTHGNTMLISLLRSPKAPDDQADMGTHEFSYALFPHSGKILLRPDTLRSLGVGNGM